MDTQNIIVISLLILAILVIILIYKSPTDKFKCENMIDLAVLENIDEYSGNCNGDNCCNKHKLIAHAENFSNLSYHPDYAWLSRYNLMPWWNSTRHTRNQSYDLRGDVPIVPSYVGPWGNSDMI